MNGMRLTQTVESGHPMAFPTRPPPAAMLRSTSEPLGMSLRPHTSVPAWQSTTSRVRIPTARLATTRQLAPLPPGSSLPAIPRPTHTVPQTFANAYRPKHATEPEPLLLSQTLRRPGKTSPAATAPGSPVSPTPPPLAAASPQTRRFAEHELEIEHTRTLLRQTNYITHRQPIGYLVLGRPVLPRNRLALRREELPHLDKLGNAVAPELYAGRNTEAEAEHVRLRDMHAHPSPALVETQALQQLKEKAAQESEVALVSGEPATEADSVSEEDSVSEHPPTEHADDVSAPPSEHPPTETADDVSEQTPAAVDDGEELPTPMVRGWAGTAMESDLPTELVLDPEVGTTAEAAAEDDTPEEDGAAAADETAALEGAGEETGGVAEEVAADVPEIEADAVNEAPAIAGADENEEEEEEANVAADAVAGEPDNL